MATGRLPGGRVVPAMAGTYGAGKCQHGIPPPDPAASGAAWRNRAANRRHGIAKRQGGGGFLPPGFCPAGMVPPIGGTVQPPYWAAQNGGGGVAPAEWRVQRTPNGALSLPGLVAGPVPARQLPGGALSGGIPPDIMRGGAGACVPPGLWAGRADPAAAGIPAAACLHAGAMAPAETVPAGTVPGIMAPGMVPPR